MPTVAQQFFFGAIDDDQDFPGVTENVKKLLEAAPAANTATTVTWTTTTIVEKTVIPLTANAANGDTTTSNGWAFNDAGADGLGSVAGALRRIPAGVWQFNAQITLNTPALLDTHALTLTARVYRVADINAGAGGVRTLLFSATSANRTATANVTWSGASQPEILLQPGQVILIGLTATSASTTALLLGANANTVMTVTLGANTRVTVPSPGVETIANTSGSSAGSSNMTGALAATGATAGTSSGLATADAVLSATGATQGSSSGSADVQGTASAVSTTNGSVSASSTASAVLVGIGATQGTSEGIASAAASGATVLPTAGTSAGIANAEGVLSGVGITAGQSAGTATALGSMGAVAEGAGTAQGSSTVQGSMAAVAPTVGTVNVGEGGGGTVINVFPVFTSSD